MLLRVVKYLTDTLTHVVKYLINTLHHALEMWHYKRTDGKRGIPPSDKYF